MRLLVIDDEPGVRKSIQMIASIDGWETFACDQFGDAARLIRDYAIDVLVCDYQMPPITGFQIIRQLRDANLHLPVVMITANPSDIDRSVARSLGIHKILGKPADVTDVRRMLNEAAAKTMRSA
jgi:DNA-binding response OmpR family regulator